MNLLEMNEIKKKGLLEKFLMPGALLEGLGHEQD